MYGINTELKAAKTIKELWEKADENGYWINLPSLFNSTSKIELIEQVEECFHESKKIANEYQVDLRLPSLYPDAKKRSCPYVDGNVAVIRSDGKVVPCLEFAYSHPMYINAHVKHVSEVIIGDLRREKLEDIWNKESYSTFREIRRSFVKNIPWCGDCSYSTNGGCYFTETNESDCRANEPGCSECVYSVGLAQCNI
jgi:radical SAM protein with 4Fe4S-binding SPASM domain